MHLDKIFVELFRVELLALQEEQILGRAIDSMLKHGNRLL